MTVRWEDVVAFALGLPEVVESTSYRTPALKVKGKLMARLRTDDDGGLAIRCSSDEKAALTGSNSSAFYTTPHYDGHDYVLVDLDQAPADQVMELIDAAWWIAAPARARQARTATT